MTNIWSFLPEKDGESFEIYDIYLNGFERDGISNVFNGNVENLPRPSKPNNVWRPQFL
jgi:hypothetical protein